MLQITEIIQIILAVFLVIIPFIQDKIFKKRQSKILLIIIGVFLLITVVVSKILEAKAQEKLQEDSFRFMTPLKPENLQLEMEFRFTIPLDSIVSENMFPYGFFFIRNFCIIFTPKISIEPKIQIVPVQDQYDEQITYEIQNIAKNYREKRKVLQSWIELFFMNDTTKVSNITKKNTWFIMDNWIASEKTESCNGIVGTDSLIGLTYYFNEPTEYELPESLFDIDKMSAIFFIIIIHRTCINVDFKDFILHHTNGGSFDFGWIQDTTIESSTDPNWCYTKIMLFAEEPFEHFCVQLK